MHTPRLVRVAAPLVIGALVLSACGSKKTETGAGAASGNKVLTLGVIAPLSGDLSAVGNGIKNGAELAIKQANAKGTVKGYTPKLSAEDDTAKADVGATVAAKLVSDASVIGVVGPLNSSVAKSVAPVMAQADITLISPSNSGVDLTGRGALVTGGTQTRPYKSYFRVCATDDIQGPFGAKFVTGTLMKKTIAIVHDKKAYGQGLAEAFAKEAAKDGAKVLKTETINPGDTDFSATISKIKVQKPDFLFYGGEYPEASLLTKQMKAAGLKIPLMGGDGVDAADYIKIAGTSAEGDFATALGAPTNTLPSAKTFLTDYAAAKYADPADPYGAAAYDAANAIISALAKATAAGKSGQALRDEVTKNVQASDFDGATGRISFDQFGDTNNKVLTVYSVKSAKFVAVKTDSFK
ncbi:MAG: branched-chain amino acid ABC transporter substrate-binding protein [Pseudorhodobacter sp.]|nr:branched-chain amino acid ABC transporter substrate-binding protein [Frankiaceae bacterium]